MAPRAVQTIVAHEFQVGLPELATWTYQQFLDACQLIAERRVGSPLRAEQREAQEKWKRAKDVMG